ncbi:MAG: DNA mismatch repair endonuclease MutL [Planctomycetota bacterium]
MGRIRALPVHVVNQIAAGEVVDRPASVVKELVENALDAGARRIEVRLTEGGKARIEVRDDGCGMDPDDLAAAFLPHATSKLASVEDLDHIASLGFRGEALASIGSVARATITSRPAGAVTGGFVEDREGALSEVRPAAAAPGTVIVVEGLFAGVPARRKFLRTAATELGHVVDTLERFALSFPEAVFLVEHEGRPVVTTAAGEGRRARIGRFHGDDLARSLLEARSADDAPVHVEAYLSPPGVTRGDARLQQVYVNGRYVRDRTVGHALREAYRDLVPPGDRQPIVFLFLTCDPARVDVNVHPTKAEVRWRDPSVVHETVRRTLRAVLEGARPGVDVGAAATGVRPSTIEAAEFGFLHGGGGQGAGREARWGAGAPGSAWAGGGATAFPPAPAPGHDHAHEHAHEHGHGPAHAPAHDHALPHGGTAGARERLRPVGQVLTTYLVLESEDGLVIVDQHALHERVLFDRISDRLRTGALEVQHLLVPAVVTLSRAEAARIHEERELIAKLGWEVEAFGDDAVAVRAVPAVLRRPDPEGLLHELLSLLESGRREGLDRAALLSAVVDRMACRGAVMAGDPLHPDEVLALLAQAEALNHAHSCPHGRPTRLAMTRRDLERYFHR